MTEDDFKTLCIQHGQFSYQQTGYFVCCPDDMICNNCIFYNNNNNCIPTLFTAKQENKIIASLQSDYPEFFI